MHWLDSERVFDPYSPKASCLLSVVQPNDLMAEKNIFYALAERILATRTSRARREQHSPCIGQIMAELHHHISRTLAEMLDLSVLPRRWRLRSMYCLRKYIRYGICVMSEP